METVRASLKVRCKKAVRKRILQRRRKGTKGNPGVRGKGQVVMRKEGARERGNRAFGPCGHVARTGIVVWSDSCYVDCL